MNPFTFIPKLVLLIVFGSNYLITPNPVVQNKLSPVSEEPSPVLLSGETIIVPFILGAAGVQTTLSYSGIIGVSVSGVGQASGTEWSDAFYVYTNSAGNPVEPHHPIEFYNFTLWIDGGPADNYVQPIPPYNDKHTYNFFIQSSGNPINFSVGDVFTIDNSGNYTINVSEAVVYYMPVVENQ